MDEIYVVSVHGEREDVMPYNLYVGLNKENAYSFTSDILLVVSGGTVYIETWYDCMLVRKEKN